MATGDKRGTFEKLRRVLVKASYNHDLDIDTLLKGHTEPLLPVLHHFLNHRSPSFTRYLANQGILLPTPTHVHLPVDKSKTRPGHKPTQTHRPSPAHQTNRRFVSGVFKMMRNVFGYRPRLSVSQFLKDGFVEQKLLFVIECINLSVTKSKQLAHKHKKSPKPIQYPTTGRPSTQYKSASTPPPTAPRPRSPPKPIIVTNTSASSVTIGSEAENFTLKASLHAQPDSSLLHPNPSLQDPDPLEPRPFDLNTNPNTSGRKPNINPWGDPSGEKDDRSSSPRCRPTRPSQSSKPSPPSCKPSRPSPQSRIRSRLRPRVISNREADSKHTDNVKAKAEKASTLEVIDRIAQIEGLMNTIQTAVAGMDARFTLLETKLKFLEDKISHTTAPNTCSTVLLPHSNPKSNSTKSESDPTSTPTRASNNLEPASVKHELVPERVLSVIGQHLTDIHVETTDLKDISNKSFDPILSKSPRLLPPSASASVPASASASASALTSTKSPSRSCTDRVLQEIELNATLSTDEILRQIDQHFKTTENLLAQAEKA
ncbi:hypothetical protein AAMO2058_001215400 [Amorphochlora amoebiformis]